MLVRSGFRCQSLQAIPPALEMVRCGDADAMRVLMRLKVERNRRFLQRLGNQEMMRVEGSELLIEDE